MSWLSIPVDTVLLRGALEHLRTHSDDLGSESGQPQARALTFSRVKGEEQRCLSQIPLELTVSDEVNCASEAFLHWL